MKATVTGAHEGRVIDLSHPLEEGMPSFPGLPSPVIGAFRTREEFAIHYAPGTSFLISRTELVGNTGTYIDSPNHRYEGMPDVAALPLARLVDLPGVVIDLLSAAAAGTGAGPVSRLSLGAEAVNALDIEGKALLVHTGWDRYWGRSTYVTGFPFVTAAAATAIAAKKPALVGIDCLNIDDMEDARRPVHSILLAAGIPIIENLCDLGDLPKHGCRLFAAPVAVRGMTSFPVRAFALTI